MEKEEGVLAIGRILPVQRFNPVACQAHEFLIARHLLLGRVAQVRQKPKVKAGVAIGQKTELKRFQQIPNTLLAGKHRGHHHHRATVRRDFVRELHSWQRPRCYQPGCKPVRHRHTPMARA